MQKIILTLIFALTFNLHAKHNCMSLTTTNFKTGVRRPNNDSLMRSDCSCPCRGPRTDDNTCLECGHKKKLSKNHGTIIQDSKQHENNLAHAALDFIVTGT